MTRSNCYPMAAIRPQARPVYNDPYASLRDYTCYWKCDDAAGANFADSSANAQHLTQANAPGSTTGQVGNCRTFASASSQYGNRAASATLNRAGKSWTLSYWFYHTTVGAYQIHVSKDNAIAGEREFLIGTNASNRVEFQAPGGSITTTSGVAISATTWYHCIATWDAVSNFGTVYINNGSPSTPVNTSAISPTTAPPFRLGAFGAPPGLFMNGRIDEVLLYDRIITASERTLLYTMTSPL